MPSVHKALLERARWTPSALSDPRQHILQTAGNEYNVGQDLYLYVRDVEWSQSIQSDVHQQNIQKAPGEAGVEVLIRDARHGEAAQIGQPKFLSTGLRFWEKGRYPLATMDRCH